MVDDRAGQQIGQYQLIRLLGTGGFAEVHLGRHIHLETLAAIKLLHAQLASEHEIEQFRVEARTLAQLVHPHIVRVLDFGVEAGTPYLVMDYAPNGSLRTLFPQGHPVSPATVVSYVNQVAEALQYAHGQRLVHRDIKPENMLLGRDQEILLSDFGIALVAHSSNDPRTQGVAGTTAYMAPEQLQGKPRPASDQYALGIAVYEWLTGRRPFQGSFIEIATQHILVPPPPLREHIPDLSPAVEQVVLTALAKDARERFGSIRAFATAFEQAAREGPSPASSSPQVTKPPTSAIQLRLAQNDQTGAAASFTPESSVFFATTHLTPPAATPASTQGNLTGPTTIPPASAPLATGITAQPPASPTTPPPQDTAERAPTASKPTTLMPPTASQKPVPVGPGEPRRGEVKPVPPGPAVLPPRQPRPQRASSHWKQLGQRRLAVLATMCLLVLALVLALPTALAFLGPSATVTITPTSTDLKNTFMLSAVLGTPDASRQQVGARLLSATAPGGMQRTNATGSQTVAATTATGTVTFTNDTGGAQTMFAGRTMTGTSGVTVVLTATVLIPTGTSRDTSAAAVSAGSAGNIPAGDLTHVCINPPCTLTVSNAAAFSGGKDATNAPVVQQSDIDGAAHTLISANQPNPQRVLQHSLRVGEQLDGTAHCAPQVRADHRAGDEVVQVTVNVTFTCTGEAYDYTGTLTLAEQLLTHQAASSPGTGYALVGRIKAQVTNEQLTSDQQGTVALTVSAEGIWVYQFSTTQQQALARVIAGKTKQAAQVVLGAQPGVLRVEVQVAGENDQTLPTDPQHITIVIQVIPGV